MEKVLFLEQNLNQIYHSYGLFDAKLNKIIIHTVFLMQNQTKLSFVWSFLCKIEQNYHSYGHMVGPLPRLNNVKIYQNLILFNEQVEMFLNKSFHKFHPSSSRKQLKSSKEAITFSENQWLFAKVHERCLKLF